MADRTSKTSLGDKDVAIEQVEAAPAPVYDERDEDLDRVPGFWGRFLKNNPSPAYVLGCLNSRAAC